MGIVKFALRFPHTFYVVAILILFLGISAIKTTPTDIFPQIERPELGNWNEHWAHSTERALTASPRLTNSACTRRQAAAETTASSINCVSDSPSRKTASTSARTSGSTRMGVAVAQTVAKRLGRCLLELGGNNAMIVTESAAIRPRRGA